jgi:hypothetical protein
MTQPTYAKEGLNQQQAKLLILQSNIDPLEQRELIDYLESRPDTGRDIGGIVKRAVDLAGSPLKFNEILAVIKEEFGV